MDNKSTIFGYDPKMVLRLSKKSRLGEKASP